MLFSHPTLRESLTRANSLESCTAWPGFELESSHLSMQWHWWLYGSPAWHSFLHEMANMYVGLTCLTRFDYDYVAQNHTLPVVSQVFVLAFDLPL